MKFRDLFYIWSEHTSSSSNKGLESHEEDEAVIIPLPSPSRDDIINPERAKGEIDIIFTTSQRIYPLKTGMRFQNESRIA